MKHKITLSFEYQSEGNNIQAIRQFLGRTDEYDSQKTGTEELLVTEDEQCRYLHHDGRYGNEFQCNTLADFIKKYGMLNPCVLADTMSGFAKLTEVTATRIQEPEAESV